MTPFERAAPAQVLASTTAAQRRSSFNVSHAVHDGDAVFERHRSARAQVLADGNARPKVDYLKLAIERLRESEATLLIIGQFHSGEAPRLTRSTDGRQKRRPVNL